MYDWADRTLLYRKTRYVLRLAWRTGVILQVYDWAEEGDPEGVVEDICRLKLDGYKREEPKMRDWFTLREWDWKARRMQWVPGTVPLQLYMLPP